MLAPIKHLLGNYRIVLASGSPRRTDKKFWYWQYIFYKTDEVRPHAYKYNYYCVNNVSFNKLIYSQ